MRENGQPGLFGQRHSNRDYTREQYWGKNQFNSSFPASLLAYMHSRGLKPVYLHTDRDGLLRHGEIGVDEVFGYDPLAEDIFYNFESNYLPYEKFYTGKREHIDLVLSNATSDEVYNGLEIKLTALPDSTTDSLSQEEYSAEIVMRPSTICYLVCSICREFATPARRNLLRDMLGEFPRIKHWEVADEVIPHYPEILTAVETVSKSLHRRQKPLIVQPIWKTLGRKSILAPDCLDAFVWSNLATIHMCTQGPANIGRIARTNRSIIWIYKMLFDYYVYGHFDYDNTINDLAYGTKNDKAFAISGQVSYPLLKGPVLTHPRVGRDEIKHIIPNGGQLLLSPERRFDALIVNTPDLF